MSLLDLVDPVPAAVAVVEEGGLGRMGCPTETLCGASVRPFPAARGAPAGLSRPRMAQPALHPVVPVLRPGTVAGAFALQGAAWAMLV